MLYVLKSIIFNFNCFCFFSDWFFFFLLISCLDVIWHFREKKVLLNRKSSYLASKIELILFCKYPIQLLCKLQFSFISIVLFNLFEKKSLNLKWRIYWIRTVQAYRKLFYKCKTMTLFLFWFICRCCCWNWMCFKCNHKTLTDFSFFFFLFLQIKFYFDCCLDLGCSI